MGLIDKIFKSGSPAKGMVQGVVESAASVVDRFVHTKEEQAQLKSELEKEITSRWKSDMASDTWLSKNIRPLSFASVLIVFYLMLFFDGNVGRFTINDAYLPIYNQLLFTIVGGYFVLRSIDKRKK
ncbi:MAG: hypothetical protein HRU12_11700 [Phaeodactylibacter sp.]|nr:hypothetical protein [Phaeodactylibacter sp.]